MSSQSHPPHKTHGKAAPGLTAQRTFLRKRAARRADFGVVLADAFVRGIRDIGYKHTGTAIDELIDNSIQAGSENVHVALGYEGSSEKKPSSLAVLDDGHGMDPEMIRVAMSWGGTHRLNDRSGFGRYGFGLPTAAMSQGKSFTVFSRTDPSMPFHAVRFDLEELARGAYNQRGEVVMPKAETNDPPAWIATYVRQHFDENRPLRSGVVIDDLDGLSWTTEKGLLGNLRPHLGVTYRNFLREVNIYVQGNRVEPIDPLFLTEGARWVDLDSDRAEARPPKAIKLRGGPDRPGGEMRVRYSLLPPTFQRDKNQPTTTNQRFPVMKDHNGIIVLRNGRQLDVVTKTPWEDVSSFGNNDRNIGIEIDFPPSLDEEFRVTTSKQQVVLSERMWDILAKEGVRAAIQELRKANSEARAKLAATRPSKTEKRTSERVMEDTERFKTKKPGESPEKVARAEKNFLAEVARRAEESGVPSEQIEPHLHQEVVERPFFIEERSLPGAPFYSAEQRGGQKVITLNTAHRFYTDVYAVRESTPRLRAAVELLLFVLGDAELDATGDRQIFYKNERAEWSTRLETALDLLSRADEAADED